MYNLTDGNFAPKEIQGSFTQVKQREEKIEKVPKLKEIGVFNSAPNGNIGDEYCLFFRENLLNCSFSR